MRPYLIAAAVAALGATIGWLRWRLRIVTVFGESMRPALAPGDRLLVRRMPLARIRTGDIVVLKHPRPEDLPPGRDLLVKRAVATVGDPVPDSVAAVLAVRPGTLVHAGALIALGDNTAISYDSREFGYVVADQLVGVVLRPIEVRRPTAASPPATVRE